MPRTQLFSIELGQRKVGLAHLAIDVPELEADDIAHRLVIGIGVEDALERLRGLCQVAALLVDLDDALDGHDSQVDPQNYDV